MEFLKKKGLAVLAGIIALTLIVLIVIQALQIQEINEAVIPLANTLKTKQSIEPYPSSVNITILEEATLAWESELLQQQSRLPKVPEDLLGRPIMTSGAFSAKRTKTENHLKSLYEKKNIFWPEECNLGFETYVSNPVPNKAINLLNYELDAITYILRSLANYNISGLRNIVRKPLAVEQDKPRVLANKGKKPLKDRNENQNIIENLEIELVFKATESSVRDVLNHLVNSEKYLFSIKSLSLKNSKPLAVDLSLIEFESEEQKSHKGVRSSSFDLAALFGSSSSSDDESATDEETNKTVKAKQIFKQVLGDEKVFVGLVLEIILLREG